MVKTHGFPVLRFSQQNQSIECCIVNPMLLPLAFWWNSLAASEKSFPDHVDQIFFLGTLWYLMGFIVTQWDFIVIQWDINGIYPLVKQTVCY